MTTGNTAYEQLQANKLPGFKSGQSIYSYSSPKKLDGISAPKQGYLTEAQLNLAWRDMNKIGMSTEEFFAGTNWFGGSK